MTTIRTTATRRYSLPFGDLLGQTLSIYFRNFVPFTLLSVVVMSPWAALLLTAPMMTGGAPRGPEELLEYGLTQAGAFVLQTLLNYLLTGALVFGVVQQLRGQRASMGASLQMGLRNLGRSLGTGLLICLRLLLFCLPSIVLVLVAAQMRSRVILPISFVVALGMLVPALMEFIRLYVALPAAVMEESGGSPAIARSKSLTDGSRWPIFGALVVISLATGMVTAVLLVPIALMAENHEGMFQLVITIALTVLSQGLAATMMAVTYFLLRRGKENIDPAALASVFD